LILFDITISYVEKEREEEKERKKERKD